MRHESLGQLVSHADARQRAERMSLRQQLGIDHGVGRGQRRRQIVVVGDDDVHPAQTSVVDRLVRGDAGVARQHQAGALVDQALQPGQVDAMALGGAYGDVENDLGA